MTVKNIFKVVLAAVVGEAVLVLLTTVAQEVIVDGVNLETSSTLDLFLGGGATLLAGIITGLIISLISGKTVKLPHIIISLLIGIETTYLIVSNKVSGPIWFDIVSGLALIGSIWIGYILFQKLKKS